MIKKPESGSLESSNLISLLRTFTKEEVREFTKFLKSPFFNNRSEVTKLYLEISKYHPGYTSNELTNESIYSKLRPETAYNDPEMRMLKSSLKKLAGEFVSYKIYTHQNFEPRLNMIDALFLRNQTDMMESEIEKMEKDFGKIERWTDIYLYYEWALNIKKRNIMLMKSRIDERLAAQIRSDNDMFGFFIYDFLISQIDKFVSSAGTRFAKTDSVYDGFIQIIDIEKLKSLISIIEGPKGKLIESCYLAYRTLNEDSRQFAEELHSNILKYGDHFENGILINLYYILKFFYNQKPDKESKLKLFNITREYTEQNLLAQSEQGNIPPGSFVELIEIASQVGETKWAEEFLNRNLDRVEISLKDRVYLQSMVLINYYSQQFEPSLRFLAKISGADLGTKFRVLKCRMMYKLNLTEELLAFINTSRHFAASDKTLLKTKAEEFTAFLSLLRKMTLIRSGSLTEKPDTIALRLKELSQADSEWLSGELNLLEKNNPNK